MSNSRLAAGICWQYIVHPIAWCTASIKQLTTTPLLPTVVISQYAAFRSLGVPQLAFALSLGIPSFTNLAYAQGVPTVDAQSIASLFSQKAEDTLMGSELVTSTQNEQTKSELYQDQLDQIDATLALLKQTESFTGPLESLSGAVAADTYAIDDNNPYAERLFGDARVTIEQMIIETAQAYAGHPALAKAGINPVEFRCWFQALIKQESRFSIGARSPAAAYGLTQIIPGTAKYLGIYPAYYNDPRLQLDGGARYFLEQLNKFGSIQLALAAYNAGPGAVMKYSGIPPYKETQNYVVKISGYYNDYASMITGVDMVGSLSPKDLTIAEASNIADAGLHYGDHSASLVGQSLTRLKGVLSRIPLQVSVKDAMNLNSYAKAEVTRIAALLHRLQTVQRKLEYARHALQLAAQIRDEKYLQIVEVKP